MLWNVNGLRTCLNRGLFDFFREADADIFCLQGIRTQESQVELDLPRYPQYWNSAKEKGYSGAAMSIKKEPPSVCYNIRYLDHTSEGRVIALESKPFHLVSMRAPSSQRELVCLPYRVEWENAPRKHVAQLDEKKPTIIYGGLNVTHQGIDLKNIKSNVGNAGFLYEERDKLIELLASGFLGSFRRPYPDLTSAYTWWSCMFEVRQNNARWHIDYSLVSERLRERLSDSLIYLEVQGNDHCPIGLILTCD